MGFPPDYVMDKMATYEIRALLKYKHYKICDDWEQSRLIAYMIAQVNSRKRLKFDDIVKFYWEESEKPQTMTDEDFSRLREKAEAMINNKMI